MVNLYYSFNQISTIQVAFLMFDPEISNPFLISAPLHSFFKSLRDLPNLDPSCVTNGLIILPVKSNF